MMHRPLLIADILAYAAEVQPHGEVVSVRTEGDVHRQTYAETARRAARLAHGLVALGVRPGDRVATLAWNGHRHLELYYAISGIGAVCHTINPRLSAEQMTYIVNHADDRLLFLDTTFIPLVEKVAAGFPASLRYCVMTDRAHIPETALPDPLCYEELLEGRTESFDWPELDEDAAAGLCYTSGTTGVPKGTLYSHRSSVLHAMMSAISLPKVLCEGRRILPVVPLFHVNAWGLPYSAPMAGASLVFPGGKLDGKSLFDLIEAERVYSAWGVPTVWQGLQMQIAEEGRPPRGFGHVAVGGAAAPRRMIETFEDMGVEVTHAWGMTEMSPIGTVCTLPSTMDEAPREARIDRQCAQGRRIFGVELKIVDEQGRRLPHDGKATGELCVRGNAVASGYYENPEASAQSHDAEGWFRTGDVARITPDGFLIVTDRAKDLIKSGGEWISSVDLENAVMRHPKVGSCAAIAVADEKWGERPLLVVQPAGEERPPEEELLDLLAEHFAEWQLPDQIVYLERLPLTATGKVSKLTLRQKYAEMPAAVATD
jgi:fatty-acyl-CoA synthase